MENQADSIKERNLWASQLEAKRKAGNKIIALAGNPNVGKSTIFNALTGLKQHTGNWPGKTVTSAYGSYVYKETAFTLVDIPGTYSLMANSTDEEVARDFICFGNPDATVVVLDATCIERNLNLVLQTLEITSNVVVVVNLLDEARRKKIAVNVDKLSKQLGVPVIPMEAARKKGFDALMEQIFLNTIDLENNGEAIQITYPSTIEQAISILQPVLTPFIKTKLNPRWVALKLLENDALLVQQIAEYTEVDFEKQPEIQEAKQKANELLAQNHINRTILNRKIVTTLVQSAEVISSIVVSDPNAGHSKDRKIDRYLTSKVYGIPIMLLLLFVIFWLTITGANYPSELLFNGFSWLGEKISMFFDWIQAPQWIHDVLVLGIYRTLTWVISVMLPPMAIFFPLFALLEDLGYLPRLAFNTDRLFHKAQACGKQALTMCMGFGCNAAAVTNCRIIGSPREQLIAVLTNNFVPCNGRFPTLIVIITMFFTGMIIGPMQSVWSTLILLAVILFSVFMTLVISRLLSGTILHGVASTFTLELPPYRKPQIGKVIMRSILDRTLFVLWRAIKIAAPAGLLIWILANIQITNASILTHITTFLDPFAQLIGLDGYILAAFILGLPANEIVLPILIMAYLQTGYILELDSWQSMRDLFVSHGWTWLTAVCVMLFSLMHWPCGTTLLTIKKETGSWKWTGLAFLIPTATGIAICLIVASTARLLGLV